MNADRRSLLKAICSLPALSLPGVVRGARPAPASSSLPDRANFRVRGVYLDAAYAHPLSLAARNAYAEFLEQREINDQRIGPGHNARNSAVEQFARLINAAPRDVAVVPSTMEA
ncbi:MAG TPA: hypothetical protein VE998_04520, partial [Terriglobales bacterium]|nr:hypothetical protein [Terriglobales bacterium]